jgi:hypothetical protein
MGNDGGKDQDRRSLLDLLERAALERDAASQLLLSGGTGQGPSVALHVFRGWHAVATAQSRLTGNSDPDLETFELTRESEILTPLAPKRLGAWVDSFDRIREAALAVPWYGEAGELDPKDLRRQIQLLGTCISAQRRRVVASTDRRWNYRFRWHHLVTAAAAVILAFIGIDLGNRLVRSIRAAAEAGQFATVPANIEINLDEVRDFKPRGSTWDAAGNIVFHRRLSVSLGDIRKPDTISVSLDGNDAYILRLFNNGDTVGLVAVGPSAVDGLEVYTVAAPEHSQALGIDMIVVEVDDGDGSHSMGHLLLNEPTSPDETNGAP